MKKFLPLITLFFTGIMFASAPQQVYQLKDDSSIKPANITEYDPAYLNLKLSQNDFKTTYDKAIKIIKEKKMKLFAVLDHSEAAKEFKQTLPPTRVIVFGNPASGTKTMNEHPNIAVELPMKVLIYERDGKTFVGFVRPSFYAKAQGLDKDSVFVRGTEEFLDAFTTQITQKK